MEEVSEACTSNLEGSVTRSLQTDGGQALLDASISKELLAVRPRPWCDLALGRGPWAAGSQHTGPTQGGGMASGASATQSGR